MARGGLAAILLAGSGCYAPHPQAGAPCAGSTCPDGLVCALATHTCELDNAPPPIDGTQQMIDAAGDAPSTGGPRLVQQMSGVQMTGGTLVLTFPKAPVAGDLLVMVGGDPQSSLTNVTGGGATWNVASKSTANANVEIWYGISDGSSAAVTIALQNSISPLTAAISEWSGLAAAAPLDIARGANGVLSPAGATITTTDANDLVILGVADAQPNTWGAPAPDTWITMMGFEGTFFSLGAWYQVRTTAGTIAAHVSETGAHWDAVAAAFHIARN